MATTNENVRINFLTTFNGKGANQASTQMGMLEKQASKLGKTMLAAFGAQKVLGFLKDSVQAFAQDQKSAALLANTMKNLFMSSDNAKIEAYISKMELATGVLDDRLRPAMETLLRATMDAGKSQELMTLALDIAAGTGKDLETVVAALSKGYLGNTTALGKLGAGLTAADLKSKNFVDIQKKLATLFKGDAATAANTFQGKLDKLKVGFDQMKESIGKGLVDAIDRLSGANGIDNVTSAMKTFGDEIGNAIAGVGRLFDLINTGPKTPLTPQQNLKNKQILQGLLSFLPGGFIPNGIIGFADYNKQKTHEETVANNSNQAGINVAAAKANVEATKKLALQKEMNKAAALEKKTASDKLALDKASLALKQAGKVFDNTAIELAAALNNPSLLDQDRKRIELKQTMLQLQDAIDNKDVALATKLSESLKQQQAGIQGLGNTISSLPQAPNVLATLTQGAKDLKAQLEAIQALQFTLFGSTAYIPNPSLPVASFANQGMASAIQESRIAVTVTVDDNGNLGAKLSNTLSDTSANGTPSTLTRVNPLTWGNM